MSEPGPGDIQYPYTEPIVNDGNVEAPPDRIYIPPIGSDEEGGPGSPGAGPEVDPEPETVPPPEGG